MKSMRKRLEKILTAVLTGMILIMPLYTCFFIFHQPEMPEEINDFRKYDR